MKGEHLACVHRLQPEPGGVKEGCVQAGAGTKQTGHAGVPVVWTHPLSGLTAWLLPLSSPLAPQAKAVLPQALELNHARAGPLEAGPVWRRPPRGSAARCVIEERVTCSPHVRTITHSAFSLRFLRDTAVSTGPSGPHAGTCF